MNAFVLATKEAKYKGREKSFDGEDLKRAAGIASNIIDNLQNNK